MKKRWSWVFALVMSLMLVNIAPCFATAEGGNAEEQTTTIGINSATVEELQALPGIDAKLAEAIVQGRRYANAEDLLKIEGIGDDIITAFEGLIRFDKVLLDENTNAEKLMEVPGIDKDLANNILDFLPVDTLEELVDYKVFDEETLKSVKDYITVDPLETEDERGQNLNLLQKIDASDLLEETSTP